MLYCVADGIGLARLPAVIVIEIRPFRNGWKCFEAPGVEPVFLNQRVKVRVEIGVISNGATVEITQIRYWVAILAQM